jgi:hypothetical protein
MADFLTYTSDYLKTNGLLNTNIDPTVITPIIILVQDKYLHPILGTDLFSEIKTQIIAGSLTGANTTLLDDHIEKVMLWYVLCEAAPAIKYQYMNKGVMVKSGDNLAAADLQEIQWNMANWKNNAEMYAERLTRFLAAKTTTYPLYLANNDCDDIRPNKTNYTSSLWLGDDDDEDDYNIRIGNY